MPLQRVGFHRFLWHTRMADVSSDLHSSLALHGLTISASPEKGRCLEAARYFFPGDIIFVQDPYVSVVDDASVDKRCAACFQHSGNIRRCSACKMTWYCSSTCQRNEWKLHQHECKAIVDVKEKYHQTLTSSLRLMLRLLIRRKLQADGVIPMTAMDNYKMVEALPTHMADVDEKRIVLYAQMANLVNMIKPYEGIEIKEITQNFCRFACNAHTICDNELRPLGTGIYPIISIINHSCLPNAVLLFDGRRAVVRAVDHIQKGTELTVSYVEIAASTAARQRCLKEQYFFDCKCSRCVKMGNLNGLQEDAVLEGFWCHNERCEGFLLHDTGTSKRLICQSCGRNQNEDDMKQRANEVDKALKEASKLFNSGNYSEARSCYSHIEQVQSKLWHPYSVCLMRTRDALLKICMELQDWTEALKYCRLTIPAYERSYPSFHPLVGLQHYTCGKLEWFLGNTTEALKSFSKARDILVVTHGHNMELVKELIDRIQEASAEAAHMQLRCEEED